MSTAVSPMTTEELLAMPDDGVDRWLIAGELRERPVNLVGVSRERPMTVRNRFHCRATVRLSRFLDCWLDEQPEPRGQILAGEAGIILHRNPDTIVGVDVAYVPADVMVRQTSESTMIDGVPILAAEILSPGDTIEDLHEKIDVYLTWGVAVVWVVDPYDRTVKVYRKDAEPELFNARQELTGEPHLPGFGVPVARLFD
jgi:Uma2 family endonuclease